MAITFGDPIEEIGNKVQQPDDLIRRAQDSAVNKVMGTNLPPLYRESIDTALSKQNPPTPPQVEYGEPIRLGAPARTGSTIERYITAPFGRGIDTAQGNFLLMFGDTEGYSEQQKQIAASLQLTEEDQQVMQEITEAETLWDGFKLWLTNPGPLAAMASQSLGTMTPAFAAAGAASLLPGAGLGVAATILGTYSGGLIEMVGEIEQKAIDRGIDTTNSQAMDELLAEPGFLKEALTEGAKRGLPIGLLDAISVGVVGKTYNLVKGARKSPGFANRMAATMAEFNTQGTLGGAGEALAGAATGEYNPGEIAAEYLGEAVTLPGELAVNALARRRTAPPPEDTGQPPLMEVEELSPDGNAEIAAAEEELLSRQRGELPLAEVEELDAPLPEIEVTEELTDEEVEARLKAPLPGEERLPEIEVTEVEEGPVEPPLPEIEVTEVDDTAPLPEIEVTEVTPANNFTSWLVANGPSNSQQRYKNKVGTRKHGSVVAKEAIKDIAGIFTAKKLADLPDPPSSNVTKGWGEYFEAVVNVAEEKFPEVAIIMNRAAENLDADYSIPVLKGLVANINTALEDIPLKILSTPYEAIIHQYRRARLEADTLYTGELSPETEKPVEGGGTVEDAISSLHPMRVGTRALYDERLSDQKNNPQLGVVETVNVGGQSLTPDDVFREVNRVFGAGNVKAEAGARVYKLLSALGKALEKPYKARDARVAKLTAQGLAAKPQKARKIAPAFRRPTSTPQQAVSEDILEVFGTAAEPTSSEVREDDPYAVSGRGEDSLNSFAPLEDNKPPEVEPFVPKSEKAKRVSRKKAKEAKEAARSKKTIKTIKASTLKERHQQEAKRDREADARKAANREKAGRPPEVAPIKPASKEVKAAREAAAAKAEEELAAAQAARQEHVEKYGESVPLQTKRRSTDKLLKALRIGSTNKLRQLGGSGLISGIKFFQGMLPGEAYGTATLPPINSDANYVGSFRDILKGDVLKRFDALIDSFVNAKFLFEDEETPVGTVLITQRGYRSTQDIAEGKRPLPSQLIEEEIKAFVESIYPNDTRLQRAVVNYARALRTVSNHGYEQGQIVFDSESSQTAYDSVLAKLGQNFEQRVRAFYEDGVGSMPTMHEAAVEMRNGLPRNNFLRPILTRLIDTGIDVPIKVNDLISSYGRYMLKEREIILNPVKSGPGVLTRTLIHEMVHASTAYAYAYDSRVQGFINHLFDRTVAYAEAQGVNLESVYGLKDQQEFIAEAFSNKEFQDLLAAVKIPRSELVSVPEGANVLQRLWAMVRRVVLRLSNKHTAALSVLLENQAALFEPESVVQSRVTNETTGSLDLGGTIGKALNTIHEQFEPKQTLMDSATKTNLGLMNFDHMERQYRHQFDEMAKLANTTNPITRMYDAISKVSSRAQRLAKEMQQLTEKTNAIEERERMKLYEAMQATTLAQVDPTVDPSKQSWLFDKNNQLFNQERVDGALAAYDALGESKPVYTEWRDLLKTSRIDRRTGLLILGLLNNVPELSRAQVEIAANSESWPALRQYLESNNVDLSDSNIEFFESVYNKSEIKGPYFPLRREGKFVTYVEGDTAEESYFAMHKTRALAEKDAALVGEGAKVARKSAKDMRTIGVQQAATAIASKLQVSLRNSKQVPTEVEQKAATALTEQIYNAVNEMLADQVLYSSQLKRKGIEGAQARDMPANLEGYVRSTINATSTLESSFDYEQGLNDLLAIQKVDGVTFEQADIAELIRVEMLIRAKEIAADRGTPSTISRILGSIGFYTFLGAPSYWILNATQTAIVGVPVLAGVANITHMNAVQSMFRAYETVKRATKGKGWRALDDLDGVMAELRSSGMGDQADVVQKLIDDNVVQATLAHELGLYLSDGPGLYNKVTGVLQKVPEMIERWNRLSMALAAMDSGVTDYVKIRDIVLASQFDYSAANRARLLKTAPEMLEGGARQFITPMMMFKVFGVSMARIVYQNMIDGLGLNKTLRGDASLTQEENSYRAAKRAEARKILGGILATHTLAGGVVGGLGLGMGSMVIDAVNLMLDDEDEFDPERVLDQFLTDHTNDYVARLVMKGLPAAVGVDFSSSTNLGNLMFSSRDQDWTEYGGVEQSVYSLMGPVAQYFAGGVREGAKLISGEATVGDFAEKAVPLKLARALFNTYDYASEGLETRQGQTFFDPSKVDAADLLISALGLRPAVISQQQQRFYDDRTYNRTLEQRKSDIMSEVITANTSGERRRARADMREWNSKMRQRKNWSLIIAPRNLQNSRNSRGRVEEQYGRGVFTEYN